MHRNTYRSPFAYRDLHRYWYAVRYIHGNSQPYCHKDRYHNPNPDKDPHHHADYYAYQYVNAHTPRYRRF